MYQKSTKKKDKIGNTILSLAQGVNKGNNHHIFIILQFLLILNIKSIITKYIYIEKFITKLVINDSKLQSKLLAISLLSIKNHFNEIKDLLSIESVEHLERIKHLSLKNRATSQIPALANMLPNEIAVY
ncbi:hypothetical protein [Bacillus thuringiensis]|uniref:hypothetical protein n=1 Tax=Bacillus thuringiensis TaxID=1428 RepID=UPI001F0B21A6|nr:hypothetical protein [Bacillus thuringiensis]